MCAARTDYHIHPNYSIDASPSRISEYCALALALNLAEICFTTHVELDPVRREIDNFVMVNGIKVAVDDRVWLDEYFREIAGAQEEYKNEALTIKAGIEVGYCEGVERDIEKIIDGYPFDFVLGAIHCLDHIAISSMKESPRYFCGQSISRVRSDYFRALNSAVTSGLFDCIAHVDLYRRYGMRHCGPEILTMHRGVIEPIFEEMARRGMGLEINTSSRRRGLQELHPSREILALAARAGITVFTVGSDAHSLEQLGDYIDEALMLLDEFNLTSHVFTRRHATPLC